MSMRRTFFIYVAITFLFRGLLGDAMAVTMAYSASNYSVDMPPSCHSMMEHKEAGQDKAASSMQKVDCQLCCAIAAPGPSELLVRPPISTGPQLSSISNLSGTTVLPAFKPPIL
jgi:hypothetical protein